MAITKIGTIHQSPGTPGKHLKNAINYILNPEKTREGLLTGSLGCSLQNSYQDMIETKKYFGKTDKRQGYHIILSLPPNEGTAEQMLEITKRFTEEFLGKYEAVYAVHDDTDHLHGHIVWNSVSCIDGYKYRYERGDWARILQPLTNKLCKEFGLSTLQIEDQEEQEEDQEVDQMIMTESVSENVQMDTSGKAYEDVPGNLPPDNLQNEKIPLSAEKVGMPYIVWLKNQQKEKTDFDLMREDIDLCLSRARTYNDFLEKLVLMGYKIRGKEVLSLLAPGAEKAIRTRRLGDEYTVEQLKKRIGTIELSYSKVAPAISKISSNHRHMKKNRAKLTPYQKRYFRKLYLNGKITRYRNNQAWKYRQDITELHKLQDQVLLLTRYEIKNIFDLKEMRIQWESQKAELIQRRKVINTAWEVGFLREKKEISEKLKELRKKLKTADRLYGEGKEVRSYGSAEQRNDRTRARKQKSGEKMERSI
ncbi:relaxase/mobilization nuclease domain-containing protein [Cuneatibacter caecimuris]|uniref:Relaxase/mobilization nuclease-like protein n=1 Tax=Cuneatibacter caecimuris TaxID=1796618 RepID=A0A4V2F7V7_9FIRM|nr:relaxase/mobilization nuclease domain-containing protein [Cuneatibacter caecimuris]RZT01169.1 relaxase/mobilization nuclease-like protein [Cuneatibacter caecimuris]